MRNAYICEKCGLTFEDYSAASKHEDQHKDLTIGVNSWELRDFTQYSQNPAIPIPTSIFAGYFPDPDTLEISEVRIYEYKLVGTKHNAEITKQYIEKKLEEAKSNKREQERIKVRLAEMVEYIELDYTNLSAEQALQFDVMDKTEYYPMNRFYKEVYSESFKDSTGSSW